MNLIVGQDQWKTAPETDQVAFFHKVVEELETKLKRACEPYKKE